MDRQDNESLHQKASEHYLEGQYVAALALWRTLRDQAPDDERASEGIRLCEMMSASNDQPIEEPYPVEEAAPVEEPAPVEEAVPAAEAASFLDVAPEGEDVPSFDLDTSILEEMPDTEPAGSDRTAEEEVEQVLMDLDGETAPPEEPAPVPNERLDASAAAELEKRKEELLAEARTAGDEGRDDDALGVLARLFILDEEHLQGRALEAMIRQKAEEAASEIEDKMTEAVQWMENGRLEDAEANLRRVLDLSPSHKEAEQYLDQVLQRMEEAAAESEAESEAEAEVEAEKPAGAVSDPTEATMEHGAVDLDAGDSENLELGAITSGEGTISDDMVSEPFPETESADRLEDSADVKPAKSGLLNTRNLIVAGVILVMAAIGWYFLWGKSGGEPAPVQPAGESRTMSTERSTEELIKEAEALSGDATGLSQESAAAIPGLVQEARRLMDETEYASAILAWDTVLELDPTNTDARRGIEDAGHLYREQKERSKDLVRAGYLFQEGDFSSALKILYRLPDDIHPEKVITLKVNGWYNLGVISLKAGRIDQALEQFGEIRLLEVEDPEAEERIAFAESYVGRTKDRSFYQDVNDLAFRTHDGN